MPANDTKNASSIEKDLTLRAPEMTILSDHPILRDGSDEKDESKRERDSFELHTRLGAVYDIIRHENTRAPLAVGIFGDWGTGKSSAMRWLSDQLKVWSDQGTAKCKPHYRCRCVWFEPWKYQTRDDVWRGLIAEVIINSINPADASVATVMSAVKQFGAFLGRSFIHAVSSMKLKPRAEVGVGVAKVVGEVEINLDSLTKIAEDYKRTTHPEKAYLNEFESTLKSWVKDFLGGDERMVLFIDDLDRCLPHVVLEVLEALKLYLNIPQLIFVIGLDRDVVKAVIRKQYKEAGLAEVKADSYLDKMFQVELEVPPSEEQMDGYFAAQVRQLDAATDRFWSKQLDTGGSDWKKIIESAIQRIAEHNPREVKRLLNSTLMRGAAAAKTAKGEKDAATRFGQGCQAYLIARKLRDDVLCPASILRYKETWTFFEAWSKFLKMYPLHKARRVMGAGSSSKAENELKRGENVESRDLEAKEAQALDAVRALVPRTRDKKRDAYPLMEIDLLWDLMEIEVSADVGQSVATKEAVSAAIKPSVNQTQTVSPPGVEFAPPPSLKTQVLEMVQATVALSRLPRIAVSRLAKAVGMDANDLLPRDVFGIQELDLSKSDFSDDGIALLVREGAVLSALTSLNLSYTNITDTGLKELARADTGLNNLTYLNLAGTHATDVGIKHLARPDTGLKALTSLELNETNVTDAAVKELAHPDTGLKALISLNLSGTQVTDAGLKDLAHPETGLKALNSLNLMNTTVTDAGMKDLARSDTGLKALTSLNLSGTQVTDTAIKDLAHTDTGVKALTSLFLWDTHVTDTGVKEIARMETGLKALSTLFLWGTQVTDAGLKDLANPNTGLKALTSLDLWGTQVTDAGLKDLANPNTGLKALRSLNLGYTKVTDAGMKSLARPDTGLKALTSLYVNYTQVTDEGVKELTRTDTGLNALTSLDLGNTQVTDAGVRDLAHPETGLNALTSIYLVGTQVTDEGEAALTARFPGIEIVR